MSARFIPTVERESIDFMYVSVFITTCINIEIASYTGIVMFVVSMCHIVVNELR